MRPVLLVVFIVVLRWVFVPGRLLSLVNLRASCLSCLLSVSSEIVGCAVSWSLVVVYVSLALLFVVFEDMMVYVF